MAKNLILAGPKQVTLYDQAVLTIADVGRNYYASPNQIGKVTRAEASLPHLKELNANCIVNATTSNEIDWM